VVVAINKMDMVDYKEDVYNEIVSTYSNIATELDLQNVYYIPVSALRGDNIIATSENTSWFKGRPLLPYLEQLEVNHDNPNTSSRFQVQYVIRPQSAELHDYRGYAGKISSGKYSIGDAVKIFPSGLTSTISAIEVNNKEVQDAHAGQSVILHLKDDVDVTRGDAIIKVDELPNVSQEFDALLCWMDHKELTEGNKYLLQQGSRKVKAIVKEITYKLDVNTLTKHPSPASVGLNDVVRVRIKTAEPLAYDTYAELPNNGTAILIDQTSNMTAGACLLQ
ncbi:MAG TPA: hypothetical protein VM368_09010, partial [Flavisolibacter sp.]|nr:hypothetical protein [Flavisolibacter sp.]